MLQARGGEREESVAEGTIKSGAIKAVRRVLISKRE